jgi:hypothetical protein
MCPSDTALSINEPGVSGRGNTDRLQIPSRNPRDTDSAILASECRKSRNTNSQELPPDIADSAARSRKSCGLSNTREIEQEEEKLNTPVTPVKREAVRGNDAETSSLPHSRQNAVASSHKIGYA